MMDIARLLFGGDARELLGLFGGDGDASGMTDRVRRAGEWCGSTPDRVSSRSGRRGSPRPTI